MLKCVLSQSCLPQPNRCWPSQHRIISEKQNMVQYAETRHIWRQSHDQQQQQPKNNTSHSSENISEQSIVKQIQIMNMFCDNKELNMNCENYLDHAVDSRLI
uniref:Uncharacterized protein n=1 Tax=Cacopsylla melanoneura TaxID=428564 RepID=A0A8D8WW65_9HEMI